MTVKVDAKIIVALAIVAVILLGSYGFSVENYAGGWEVTDHLTTVTINGDYTYDVTGNHYFSIDPDGEFTIEGRTAEDNLLPDITIEMSYPYYLQKVSDDWIRSSEPFILDSYTKQYSAQQVAVYQHYVMAFDLTIKTGADSFYKPLPWADYGYYYEAATADVLVRAGVSINSWSPVGLQWDENHTVVNGWAGIMSMSVLKTEYGLVEEQAEENYGHTIQDIISDGAALNMFVAEQSVSASSFDDPNALANVPTAVDTELSATLKAGAWYHPDWLGHWDAIAVRNVFVKYTVRVDIVATAVLEPLELGDQEQLANPNEDNTGYAPQVPFFSDLALWWEEMLASIDWWQWLIIIVVGVVIVYIVLKIVVR